MKWHDLTHAGLVLAPQRARGARLRLLAAALVLLAVGAAAGYAVHEIDPRAQARDAAAQQERQQLQSQAEQARQLLRVSEARGKELERQIDALNQRQRELEEELAFFRKTTTRH